MLDIQQGVAVAWLWKRQEAEAVYTWLYLDRGQVHNIEYKVQNVKDKSVAQFWSHKNRLNDVIKQSVHSRALGSI